MRRGFTLIEILVTLTIMGLLFGFGFAGFRDFSRRQAVASAGRMVIGDLRLAQQKSLSGEKPSGCTGSLLRYDFNRVAGGLSYQIIAVCSGGNNTVNINLPSGISISSFTPNPISFKILGRGTNVPVGTDAAISLTQTGTVNTMTITVNSGGEIK